MCVYLLCTSMVHTHSMVIVFSLFAGGVITALLRQLEIRRQGHYLSSRVVQGIFNYLGEA